MAKEARPRNKSESLTIRLDQKSRFVLEYISRIRGQNITTIVERAIMSAAAGVKVEDHTQYGAELGWDDFWDVSEGVRALKMAAHKDMFPSYEEEKRLAFAVEHWPFFWSSERRTRFLNFYVDILWPRIDDFVAIHDASKANATDYSAAAKAMIEVLDKAKIEPPVWPPKKPDEPKPAESGYGRNLDDEIPF